ncbi:MAG: TasA family protein, partial [Patescibacteria group bacterium]
MKRIILSLAVIAVVGLVSIGGTLAYLSDTATVEGNVLSTGSVALGEEHNLPFEIENLAPGESFQRDLAVQYDGSLPADLYIGAKEEGGMDLGQVLQYKLQRMETSKWTPGDWIVGGESTWKDFSGNANLLAAYIKTHEGLEEGDWARVRLHIRMKDGDDNVDFDDIDGVHHWNDYQNMEESITLIMHAVQEGGTPDLGVPRDYDPQIRIVGGDTYNTISAAVDKADNDNTILVPQGVYEEDVEL